MEEATTEAAGNQSVSRECPSQLPTVIEYITGLDLILTVIIVLTIVLSIATFVICGQAITRVLRQSPKRFKTKTIIVLLIYPVVAALAIISILIPKAYFICDTVSHIYFMICAYVFYSLLIDYVGGEDSFIKSTDSETFNTKTPPCCCCLFFLKRTAVTKNRLLFTRLLILQLPIVQSLLFLGLNVVFVEDTENFNQIILYFVPFIVLSIIIGVWGLNIAVRMVDSYNAELKSMAKYFALQAVLMFCKVQPLVIMVIITYVTPRCDYPLVLQVQKNAVFQMCLCAEMLVLSIWAFYLYKTPSKNRNLLATTETN
ncbi:organic solute transporter alpha-like protein [Wyeomyia smithii]|uniref:organic solute transporter alpha-like protein n=1 Tax=Wyeomyia smithii TaxID=174621 RepID=UPI002467BD29|nr:organic solute transporter alpha-like protein [Wyeomyia smithii]XP_055544540.1 organic solute transporter alpha-like protein [Wyeomyia smithii]XP_055544541.1 organic solute transporter alpha-like protein [Wyeomyia smithii]XP_055544542.1 organic solute transporter alpha-like protein [Wyeomyia smithii]